ncbi:MAG: GIY-YIG nuclease family protein [Alphaproteobacteria bacterium]|nr:GIY-YIG nuclease family protein [Alphaproteobacteria bacterium]
MKRFFVYILASRRNGTLYAGVTSDLVKRVYEHKAKTIPGFTKKYSVNALVYFELHDTAETAIQREKQIKEWQREWKIRLIEKSNPDWRDLYTDICQ